MRSLNNNMKHLMAFLVLTLITGSFWCGRVTAGVHEQC